MKVYKPIAIFLYNRKELTIATLNAINNNYDSENFDLYLYIDGPNKDNDLIKINEVYNVVDNFNFNFKNVFIIKRKTNIGLKESIIKGVSDILEKNEAVIVLEDDLITSKFFLNYMNDALDKFKNRNDIGSISGYSYSSEVLKIPMTYDCEIYISRRPTSWGWATWKSVWDNVDWNIKENDISNYELYLFSEIGKDLPELLNKQWNNHIDSWAIFWALHHWKYRLFCIYPVKSLVSNNGFGIAATHTFNGGKKYSSSIVDHLPNLDFNFKTNEKIINRFKLIYKSSKIKRVLSWLGLI
tara:strand:- start:10154 stop:11047 length:894 start_codon:yes stop_codon:yes gene_type:complete